MACSWAQLKDFAKQVIQPIHVKKDLLTVEKFVLLELSGFTKISSNVNGFSSRCLMHHVSQSSLITDNIPHLRTFLFSCRWDLFTNAVWKVCAFRICFCQSHLMLMILLWARIPLGIKQNEANFYDRKISLLKFLPVLPVNLCPPFWVTNTGVR